MSGNPERCAGHMAVTVPLFLACLH
jgi:hypothetical protein